MRPPLVMLALVLSLALSACASGMWTPAQVGMLEGQVRIGPMCPVEPCADAVNPYEGRSLELRATYRPLTLVALASDGTFNAEVPAGLYTVGLSDCGFLGCARALPVRVEVHAGQTATLTIEINTGIR